LDTPLTVETDYPRVFLENCILASNGTYGVNFTIFSNAGSWVVLRNEAYFGNTTAATTIATAVPSSDTGGITLAALPFVDAPNGDFPPEPLAASAPHRLGNVHTRKLATATLAWSGTGTSARWQHKEPPQNNPGIGD